MGSSQTKLTQLQRDILEAFFARETQFALTGKAALGGFHLGHRQSQDLDLFARPPATLDSAERALQAAASDCSAQLSSEQRFPEFRRFRAARGDDATIIDLAIDRAPAVDPAPVCFGAVRVHSLREIAANKICTLLSRAEIRDLVDLKALLEAGTGQNHSTASIASNSKRSCASASRPAPCPKQAASSSQYLAPPKRPQRRRPNPQIPRPLRPVLGRGPYPQPSAVRILGVARYPGASKRQPGRTTVENHKVKS
jgi:hypothetical protein